MKEDALTRDYAMVTTGMSLAVELLRVNELHLAAMILLKEVDRRTSVRRSAFLAKTRSVTA